MMSSPPKVSTAVSTNRSAKPSSVTLPTHGDGLAAGGLDRAHGLLRGLGVEIVDHDARALGGELERDRPADAAAGAGDDRDLALQVPMQVAHACDRRLVEGDHGGAAEADVVLQGELRALDLTGAGLSAQLPDQLGALRQPGRAERVPLGRAGRRRG